MCKVYRMNLFAKNKVVARSRFWYFMKRLCRVKKANGQIISVSQVSVAATADKPRSSHSDSSAGRQQHRVAAVTQRFLLLGQSAAAASGVPRAAACSEPNASSFEVAVCCIRWHRLAGVPCLPGFGSPVCGTHDGG